MPTFGELFASALEAQRSAIRAMRAAAATIANVGGGGRPASDSQH